MFEFKDFTHAFGFMKRVAVAWTYLLGTVFPSNYFRLRRFPGLL